MVFRTDTQLRKFAFRLSIIGTIATVVFLTYTFISAVLAMSGGEAYVDTARYDREVKGKKVIALTFDDGPDAEQTGKIMDILDANDVPATFFFLGTKAIRHPDIVKEAHRRGFEIGNHTFTHSYGVHSSRERLARELNVTSAIIKGMTGERPNMYRPPFLLSVGGEASAQKVHETAMDWAAQSGYYVIGADVDSKDWKARSTEEIVATFFEDLPTGNIALFHDGLQNGFTVEALGIIIPELKARGYEFVTASEILGIGSRRLTSGSIPQASAAKYVHSFEPAPQKTLTDALLAASIESSSTMTRSMSYAMIILLVLALGRLIILLSLFAVSRIFADEKPKRYEGGVSVIVPVYNEVENVEGTLMSILANDYGPLEIIAVNDGSTDGSEDVILRVAAKYPGTVRAVTIPNGGKSNALNVGISMAKYDIVITTDGDSILTPDAVAKLVRHFNDPKVGAAAGKIEATRSGNFLNRFQHIEYVIGQNIDKEAMSFIGGVGVVPGPLGAWRKQAILDAGGYGHDTLVEDQDLTLALLARGYKVVYEPDAVSYTETPHTVRDFVKQRFRWVFGTMQCAWKYKGSLFSLRSPALGWAVLPNTAIYSIFLSLLHPFIDAMFVVSIFMGTWPEMLSLYIVFTLIDYVYSGVAFWTEKRRWDSLSILPAQRFFYRFVISYVVIKGVIKAIEGTEALWNKVAKRGAAQEHLLGLDADGGMAGQGGMQAA